MEHMETRDSGRFPIAKDPVREEALRALRSKTEQEFLGNIEPIQGHDMERIAAIDKEVEASWRASENGGWHKSWDHLSLAVQNGAALEESYPRTAEDVTNWVVNKLMLVASELTEAQDELRKGKELKEVYYTDEAGNVYEEQVWEVVEGNPDPVPQYKPEGFLVEVADAVIRLEDLVGIVTEGAPSFGKIKLDKIQFNGTRGVMHGGKKF